MYRIKKWFTSFFLLIGSGLLFQILPYILWGLAQGGSSDGDVWMIPVAIVAIAGLFWFASITVIGGSLRYEVQVDADGEERGDHFSLTGAIKEFGGRVT